MFCDGIGIRYVRVPLYLWWQGKKKKEEKTDSMQTAQASGNLSVKGQTVEAILGGVFTQFGSPAAHRAFHLHVLPKFVGQLRDPFLVEKVETVREQLEKEFGRGILPRE